jgi:predicted DNA-binding transcriptional regulator AlpA
MTLDDLNRDPQLASTLSRKQLVDMYRQAARLEADLHAHLLATPAEVPHDDAGDRLLTATEAAARLGYTRDWLYRHAHELPFTVRIRGGRPRFSDHGISRYLRLRQGLGGLP